MADDRDATPRGASSNAMTYALAGLGIASLVACAGYLAGREPTKVERGTEVVLETRPSDGAGPADNGGGSAAAPAAGPPAGPAEPAEPADAPHFVPRVHARYPHDPEAFTQGFVWQDGRLFESTGLVGRSSLREVDLVTGRARRSIEVDAPRFAEGLALVGDELVQITWQNHVAFVYGRNDFVKRREFEYTTEGWGLCHDGTDLVMSDGTDRLFFRDPATFAVRREVRVRRAGIPLDQLNELECVRGDVYANVWQTDTIVRIDPASGVVEAVIDAGGLLAPDEARTADVLNGIAWIPERERFLITGKLWPWVFEVTFEAAP